MSDDCTHTQHYSHRDRLSVVTIKNSHSHTFIGGNNGRSMAPDSFISIENNYRSAGRDLRDREGSSPGRGIARHVLQEGVSRRRVRTVSHTH